MFLSSHQTSSASVDAKTNAPCTCPPLVLLSGKTAMPAYSDPELLTWLNLPFLINFFQYTISLLELVIKDAFNFFILRDSSEYLRENSSSMQAFQSPLNL